MSTSATHFHPINSDKATAACPIVRNPRNQNYNGTDDVEGVTCSSCLRRMTAEQRAQNTEAQARFAAAFEARMAKK